MYEILKNRLQNGTPFITQTALDRISALANELEITQEQAEELIELAKANGRDTMPEDFSERLARIEEGVERFEAFLEAAKASTLLNSIFDTLNAGGKAV